MTATAAVAAAAPRPTPRPRIVLRDAYYSELPAIARVMALAFWDDHIFGAMIHPHRARFPLDSDLYWLRRARVSYWDFHYKWLVAVEREGGRVVGIAQWERVGGGAKAMECAWFDPREFF